MLYVIEGVDSAESLPLRQRARPDHLARLSELQSAGRLLIAGPCPNLDTEEPGPAGFSGSLIIAEFESLDMARTWAEQDPYYTQGIFKSLSVRPFKKAFPR